MIHVVDAFSPKQWYTLKSSSDQSYYLHSRFLLFFLFTTASGSNINKLLPIVLCITRRKENVIEEITRCISAILIRYEQPFLHYVRLRPDFLEHYTSENKTCRLNLINLMGFRLTKLGTWWIKSIVFTTLDSFFSLAEPFSLLLTLKITDPSTFKNWLFLSCCGLKRRPQNVS